MYRQQQTHNHKHYWYQPISNTGAWALYCDNCHNNVIVRSAITPICPVCDRLIDMD